jgi:uncharacterized protein YbjT (DUF2867 family)
MTRMRDTDAKDRALTKPVDSASKEQDQRTAQPKPRTPALRRVTVFGGSGFIGRQLVAVLRRNSVNVAVAVRDPDEGRSDVGGPDGGGPDGGKHAPPGSGDALTGSLDVIKADVTDFDSVVAAVAGADAIVNLVGILYEKGSQTFPRVHEQGAGNVARAAAAATVADLVHMSALGASATSTSAYARSKAAGEKAVRDAFPAATIMRPSVVFGPEDDFFNKFAKMARFSPALPLIGGGTTRFQPVYVGDVAQAFLAALAEPSRRGQTYELTGPRTYTFKQLLEVLLETMSIRRVLMPLPFSIAEIEGSMLQFLPKPPLTRDQVELLKSDNVAGGQQPGLAELGIEATPLEKVLPSYLG